VVAVGVAFADSSIVVLGLPELYARFHTSIEGVSWVVTAYNAAVAVAALGLIVLVHRVRARGILIAGLLAFFLASLACSLADSLPFLISCALRPGGGSGAAPGGRAPRAG
jgi:predicted MFS family arabinose efflux permease